MKVMACLVAASLGVSSVAAKLDTYVGKHPHEAVGGRTFLGDPQVKAAIDKAVPVADIRSFIAERDLTTVPIRRVDDPDMRGADWYVDGKKVFTLYAKCPSRGEDLEGLGTFPIGPIPG